MPIIACPQCGTQLEAPDTVLGQEVVCGQCRQRFIAAAAPGGDTPAAPAAPAPQQPAGPAAPPNPYAASTNAPTAPTAGGRAWPPAPVPPPVTGPAPAAPTSGLAVASLVLGILSIVFCAGFLIMPLVCGILAVAFGGRAQEEHAIGQVSPSSLGLARAGRICGAIGITLGSLFFALMLCGPCSTMAF